VSLLFIDSIITVRSTEPVVPWFSVPPPRWHPPVPLTVDRPLSDQCSTPCESTHTTTDPPDVCLSAVNTTRLNVQWLAGGLVTELDQIVHYHFCVGEATGAQRLVRGQQCVERDDLCHALTGSPLCRPVPDDVDDLLKYYLSYRCLPGSLWHSQSTMLDWLFNDGCHS